MTTTMTRSRQAELVDRRIFTNSISIIGCGAIGSFTALTLAKMGFYKMIVWDDDTVGEENISNQFYPYTSIGRAKVEALKEMLFKFETIDIDHHYCRWSKDIPITTDYVIMAVDSMAVRKEIFDSISRSVTVQGFIDGRMGGQQAEVYAVNLSHRDNVKAYKNYLWTDSEASELPCTQKAVMYNVLWIASSITNALRLMAEGKPYQSIMNMDFQNQVQNNIVAV